MLPHSFVFADNLCDMALEILIVGGGLGGLAAAAFLRGSHNVTVLERHHLDFSKDDYGISVMSNAYSLLQKAGIDESKLDVAIFTKIWVRTCQNEKIAEQDFDTRKIYGAPSILTKRSHLQKELYRLATSPELPGQPANVIEGVKVVKVNTTTGTVFSLDGASYQADLVIGADGIASCVRSPISSNSGGGDNEANVKTHDLLAYMAQVPLTTVKKIPELAFLADPVNAAGLASWSSPGGPRNKRRILAYHSSTREVQFVGYAAEEEFTSQFDEKKTTIIKGVPAARAQTAFFDFCEALKSVFNHHRTGDGTVEVWRIRDIDPQERWSRGKVLLIGDAAHAVTPHAGQGANFAFEDAEALGFLLAGVKSAAGIDDAVSNFVKIRQPRAQDLAMSSRHMGALLSPEEVVQRGEFDRVAFGNRIYGYRGAQAALETLNAQV